MPATDNPKNVVNSVVKAFGVLRAFDADLPELTISEVAGRAEIDRGTAFRLVHTLCQLGYLAPVPRSRRYRLTLKCLELGYTPLARANLKVLTRPLLVELVPDVVDAASLGMLDGESVVYVERVQVGFPQTFDRRVGSRTGAYAAALGHVMLAYLPEDQQRSILSQSDLVKLSERTLTDVEQLIERFRLVRSQGYAVSDGENAYGLRTVAAPILDESGAPVAGISATIRAERMELDDFVTHVTPRVRAVADELAKAVALSFGTIVRTGG
ncbi:IclR family transcriptional regulator [Telmatospirillum sp.]|uniref:IclR family transcriptional regulator n=1 Tax=Telmatospirillum sp. TaxID=2079197 RepID=UPI0028519E12|nr:IclR family transcriptional regulator [Telmatospirillum sp.]MDR3440999.1 IclR family transcriptional regulator [Telmatospirillum sp.]